MLGVGRMLANLNSIGNIHERGRVICAFCTRYLVASFANLERIVLPRTIDPRDADGAGAIEGTRRGRAWMADDNSYFGVW